MRVNEVAEKLIRQNKQQLQDNYYTQYINNYTNGIAELQKMYDSPTTDPFTKIRILTEIKQSKTELAQLNREYNNIKRDRQRRR